MQPSRDGIKAETFPGFLVFGNFMLENTALLHIGTISIAKPESAVFLLATTTLFLLEHIDSIEPTCFRSRIIFVRHTVHDVGTRPSCALSTVVGRVGWNVVARSLSCRYYDTALGRISHIGADTALESEKRRKPGDCSGSIVFAVGKMIDAKLFAEYLRVV